MCCGSCCTVSEPAAVSLCVLAFCKYFNKVKGPMMAGLRQTAGRIKESS